MVHAETQIIEALGLHPDFEPSSEDFREYEDYLERVETEDLLNRLDGKIPSWMEVTK